MELLSAVWSRDSSDNLMDMGKGKGRRRRKGTTTRRPLVSECNSADGHSHAVSLYNADLVPSDVLERILTYAVRSIHGLTRYALVCKSWYEATNSNTVWTQLVRTELPCLPLLVPLVREDAQVSTTKTPVCLRSAFLIGRRELRIERINAMRRQEHRLVVQRLQLPTLHAILALAGILLLLFTFVLILVLEHRVASVGAAFLLLWMAFALVALAVAANCVAVLIADGNWLHSKHTPLIRFSVIFVSVIVFAIAPTVLSLQGKLSRRHSEELEPSGSFYQTFLPVFAAFFFWQIRVFFAERHELHGWMAAGCPVNLRIARDIIAYCVPLMLGCATLELAAFLQTQNSVWLALALLPLMIISVSLFVLLGHDALFSNRRSATVALGAVAMFFMMIFCVSIVIYPRGYSLVFLLLAIALLLASYIHSFSSSLHCQMSMGLGLSSGLAVGICVGYGLGVVMSYDNTRLGHVPCAIT